MEVAWLAPLLFLLLLVFDTAAGCWLLAAGCLLKKKRGSSHLNRLGTPPRLLIHSLLVGRRTTSWSHTHSAAQLEIGFVSA
jgi:hypothetical protein